MSGSKQPAFYDKRQKQWTESFLSQQRKNNCKRIIFTNDINYVINQPTENLNCLIFLNNAISKDVTILLYTQNNLQLNDNTNISVARFKQFVNDRKSSYADDLNSMDYLLFDSMLIHMNWIESVTIKDGNIDLSQLNLNDFRSNLSNFVDFNNNDNGNNKDNKSKNKQNDKDVDMENEKDNDNKSENNTESTDSDMNPLSLKPNNNQQQQLQQSKQQQNEMKGNE